MEDLTNQDWYAYDRKIHVAVDCIIFGFIGGELNILLFKRKVEPLSGNWSLIGSFVKYNEDIPEAAQRVLKELTGLSDVYLQELKSYSDVNRDPGDRCISIAYYALTRLEDHRRSVVERLGAKWFPYHEYPELVLDHGIMVKDAIDALKLKARHRPIGFELLPEKFTLPQLQSLYEAIYDKMLDSRNFRKKVLSFNVLIKLEEKDFGSSKKGAFFYRFDTEKYNELAARGFDFVV